MILSLSQAFWHYRDVFETDDDFVTLMYEATVNQSTVNTKLLLMIVEHIQGLIELQISA